MINTSCPISPELVNSKLTRIYSFFTFITILVYAYTPFKEIIFITTLDFAIRIFIGIKYSPICSTIKYVLNIGKFKVEMVNAGPKKFAAKIGFLITALMSISYILDFPLSSTILAHISIIAVGAESIFGYCVACKVYSLFSPKILYLLNRK